jgi:hypothetical protein
VAQDDEAKNAGVSLATVEILPQPDNASCGPTCLHAVYRYYGDPIELEQVVAEVPMLDSGGTLAVMLGNHALRRGFDARIYTYDLQAFDPTWFANEHVDLRERLLLQRQYKTDTRLRASTHAYLEFLDLGGEVRFEDLTTGLLTKFLKRQQPILTGLSATYLYRSAREHELTDRVDDLRGSPVGHFVVLSGYEQATRSVLVADPFLANPVSKGHYYQVGVARVLNAILLGVLTYDANLLIIQPKRTCQS